MQRVLAGLRPFRWSDVDLDASDRTLLMLHDGDLADVKTLAESIGVQVIEGVATGAVAEWDVLVTSARYAKTEHISGARPNAVRIAVLDRNSRTLRTLARASPRSALCSKARARARRSASSASPS